MIYRRVAALVLVIATTVGCLPEAAPEPQPGATTIGIPRPRFELATYMYALQTRSKIRIGVLDNAPPFSSREPRWTLRGFEPDLGRALAQSIFGLQPNIDTFIEWVSVDQATGATALTSQQATWSRAACRDTGPRAVIDVSDPYFVTGERLLVQSANSEIDDLDAWTPKTVCVQSGSGVDDRVDDATAPHGPSPSTHTLHVSARWQRGQVDAIGAASRRSGSLSARIRTPRSSAGRSWRSATASARRSTPPIARAFSRS